MTARRSPRPTPPRWRVTIAEHDIPPRWHVPAQVVTVYAYDAATARANATREAHRVAGCPPWRPLLRITYRQTVARPVAAAYSPPRRRSKRSGARSGALARVAA